MFYLQLWAQLKNTVVSGAQSFDYFDKFYKNHIIFNFEPNPEKKSLGSNLNTFTWFEKNICYLYLWAPLNIIILNGAQT